MKKVIILFVLIVAFGATSFAQTDNQAAPIAEQTVKKKGARKAGKQAAMKVKKELNLTAEQTAKMKTAGDMYKGKMKAIKTDDALDKIQKKTQALETQKAHDTEIKGILTAEQYTKFIEMKKKQKEDMGARKGRKSPK